jgi:hypothetical protein
MASKKANRTMKAQPIYLVPEKAQALDDLAAESRIPKAVLLREAVDDLLEKHGRIEWKRERATSGPPRNVHSATLRKK